MASPPKDAPAKVPKKQKPAPVKPENSQNPFFWFILLAVLTVPFAVVLNLYCEENTSSVCQKVKAVSNWFLPKSLDKRSAQKSKPKVESKDATKLSNADWIRAPIKDAKLFTSEEIKYVEGGPYYLVIAGHVFDVTAGKGSYAPGSGYFGFIGQDGSRAFVTGEFNEKGLTDNLDGLSSSDYTGIAGWVKFYFEKYKFVGYHIGKFVDEHGAHTPYFKQLRQWVKNAESEEDQEKDLQKLFPPCNVSWNAEKGSTVWCTSKSGGIQRDWKGYPRKFFEKNKEPRCACVHPNMLNDPRLRVYDGCDPQSDKCIPID